MKIAFSFILAAFFTLAQHQGRCQDPVVPRRALLIANSAYQHLPRVATPRQNVDALADALSKAHFQPQVVYDLPQAGLVSTIRKFTDTIQPGDFVLIYFSGYGYQADNVNYILPVSFDPKDQSALGLRAFSLRNLQRTLEQRKAGTRMLVLDASRPGPGLPKGLAGMVPAGNTLVSFSAAPNQSAPDPPGGGVNVFTTALIRAIEEPGAKPPDVLSRAQAEVSRASEGKQVPLVIETPVPEFVFNLPVADQHVVPPFDPTGESSGRPKSSSNVSDPGAVVVAENPNVGAATAAPMWPVDGGDQRRSGYAPYRGPRKPRIAWVVDAGNIDQNSPLVGPDGRVYVWNARGRMLHCVENGRIVWSVPLPLDEQFWFGPDGSVQLTSFMGKTRRLGRDGTTMREVPSDISSLGLYVWGGHSYKSNGNAPPRSTATRWFFFRSDQQSWRVELDGQGTLPVVDESGVMYVGTDKGTIYAVRDVNDAASVLWTSPTPAGSAKGLAVTHTRDVLAAVGQSLISVRDGKVQWRILGDVDGSTLPPIHDQTGAIYFGKGNVFYAVSSSGKELWHQSLPGVVTTAPAMDRSGRIYVATATQLYCLSDP